MERVSPALSSWERHPLTILSLILCISISGTIFLGFKQFLKNEETTSTRAWCQGTGSNFACDTHVLWRPSHHHSGLLFNSFLLPRPVLLSSEELSLEQALKRSIQKPWWPGNPKNSGLA